MTSPVAGLDPSASTSPLENSAGRLALSVSKAMMAASHVALGDSAEVKIIAVGSG